MVATTNPARLPVLDQPPTAPQPTPRPAPGPASRRFRPDIQGLRAIAVLLVVLYHAHVPGMTGGYVGVDVFFVISGFLITGQLVREVGRSGRISPLPRFYARRARRLLLPAALVLAVTLVAARVWTSVLTFRGVSGDAVFAALSALNYRLAAQGVDPGRLPRRPARDRPAGAASTAAGPATTRSSCSATRTPSSGSRAWSRWGSGSAGGCSR